MNIEKKNIFLSETAEILPYVSQGYSHTHYPERDRNLHAISIQKKLEKCFKEKIDIIKYKEGEYLEFSGKSEYDLATKSLENLSAGIRLLNIHEDTNTQVTKATVFIPSGKEDYFINKAKAYATKVTKKGFPENKDLISSIEDIKLATLESFWMEDTKTIPITVPVWCELWLRYNNRDSKELVEKNITLICQNNSIPINKENIVFPERIVKLIYANANSLKLLISLCPFISEIRCASEATTFFTNNLSNNEQKEWNEELLSRTKYEKNNISVCLLDTGINSKHSLLVSATNTDYVKAVKNFWRSDDHSGHGTGMAGIALFNDLKNALSSKEEILITHEIESIKILPPTNESENPPELYGAITQQAVSLAEISNPKSKRVICMAITTTDSNDKVDGFPTSWSAAIDSITSGSEEELNEKRLFLISAGNITPAELSNSSYPDINLLHRVESPGQAWNAVTVGAYSIDTQISDPAFKGFTPVAPLWALSPYSSTSVTWENKWPIKPEVLFNGGNIASNNSDYTECPDLSLLTTSNKPLVRQFDVIYGTSSATAQAAYFCAKILKEYPDAWPETVRGLMIHSANWTKKMKEQFCSEDIKTKGRRVLLRSCGYGIPDLEKAIQCKNNSVNMIIQSELQPYNGDKMKEMHVHKLPWPKEILQSLGETPVMLKVTLSYFIEPGPGKIGWRDRYRYPSCGLRFDLINSNENLIDFKKRINKKMRGENKDDKGEGNSGSERWYLGSINRDVGSIHSDFCELNAVELCDCNYVAVFPIVGWWRERRNLKRSNKKIRYSLIVSLSTPEKEVDLYTPIITQITTPTKIVVGSSES